MTQKKQASHTPTPWEWRYFGDKLALVNPKHGCLIVEEMIALILTIYTGMSLYGIWR